MSDERTESDEQAPRPNPLVERSPRIVGIVGAAIALLTLIGLPWQFLVVANQALGWLSLAIAALGMLTIARGRQNAGAIVAIVLGLAGFAFWTAAPGVLGPLPVYAYLVTAAVHLGLGFLIPRIDPARQRGVFIACAGAVVFTVVGAFAQFGM